MKERAPRNRTVTLSDEDRAVYAERLVKLGAPVEVDGILDRTIWGDLFEVVDFLPAGFVDLLFLDPPYNLTKAFNGRVFRERSIGDYRAWMETWFPRLMRMLKPTASVYICGDWRSGAAIQQAVQGRLVMRNRITWEREKGRGAKANWKNASEDVWFCTVSDDYTFNVDAVKLRRRVIAPYTDPSGEPKDWERSDNGNTRLTHPSNVWTDLTVPYWSMPENTDHPTQKPEKLLAKVILASSNEGDVVLDPFLGSGTTSVVAKKLGRRFVGVEVDDSYCLVAEKRLEIAEVTPTIQGYAGGIFWERNTPVQQRKQVNQLELIG